LPTFQTALGKIHPPSDIAAVQFDLELDALTAL
jgi:hypothetical protein